MNYLSNPFLERMSERTTSDLDFARLFSPKILERLEEKAFQGGVHVIRSAPGAGKTTLLRAFTPAALYNFWSARSSSSEAQESFQKLSSLSVLEERDKPSFLGVLLSCASGYADLPPGADLTNRGLFRALLDCRIILRTLRSVGTLVGLDGVGEIGSIKLDYSDSSVDLKGIPRFDSAKELYDWAQDQEQKIYAQVDFFVNDKVPDPPVHVQFEGGLWLQSVRFFYSDVEVGRKRVLMIDDVHKLRKRQKTQLVDELTVQRLSVPVWLAERTIALGKDALLSQGAREGRDINEYSLEEMWSSRNSSHFESFAINILDRRMSMQNSIPSGSFSQCVRSDLAEDEIRENISQGSKRIMEKVRNSYNKERYKDWLEEVEEGASIKSLDSLKYMQLIGILIARDEQSRQMSLDLALSPNEIEERASSGARGAVDIFLNNDFSIPYYFGINRLCALATNNIEELLYLSAGLYSGMQKKNILRKPDITLTPAEQEKIIKDLAKRKRDFLPRNHTQGRRAQKLLDAIGSFCRKRTFLENAPYAPGVTGIRLSYKEISGIESEQKQYAGKGALLSEVLAECAAENLLVARDSSASTSRDGGTIFYLNRAFCAYYGLPLQYGGWQDVPAKNLISWMEDGPSQKRQNDLGTV